VPLCTRTATAATVNSRAYLFHGVCTAMDVLQRNKLVDADTADSTPAGSYQLITYRTKYGLVQYTGLRAGVPTAFTSLRSTYRHEADSAIGFQMFNDPAEMSDAAAFDNAASNIGYAFNWFYVNSTQAAYFNSGLNPVRPATADPNLPMTADAAHEWVGWIRPTTPRATPRRRPPAVGQPGLLRVLEQQAGRRLLGGRRQLQLRAGTAGGSARQGRARRAGRRGES